ncbi:rho GTPase-activating protein gacV-like [Capsicum annuum]|uniref:rho GTPase-activating protein gacV-like n=1 Tax=Capsicum annuum TaxID=4072 RepID=UPI001FB13356|nr:rho GTPase-activating protein gacV-like [Capsicum annuum]
MDEVKNNVLDGLKKELEGMTVLILNEDSNDDGDLGDAAGTSSLGDLYKHVAELEEAVLDITVYIREKKLKKKEQDERQHEQVNVDLCESERNEKGEKKSKMDELVSVVAGEEKEEEKKDKEEDMCQEEREEGEESPAEESPKEATVEAEEEPEKETTADVEKETEEGEKAPAEEVPAAADAEIEGEEGNHEEKAKVTQKKELKLTKKIWSWIS